MKLTSQQKCYCEAALQPGFNCGLGEWKPDDPQAFQRGLIKKLYSALRLDWEEGRDGNLILELTICPAEALWMGKALKSDIRKGPIKATKKRSN
jgi:hypothetical protein